MEVRVTLENLRAGEKPLAMFLHDALRHIDEQYYENIVASYARNARPSSQPSDSSSSSHRDKVLDERGRPRTSLEQFDLTFQLNLFETLLGTVRAGYSDEGIPQDTRTAFKSSLHLRGDTLYKVIALRKYRNEVVHHHLDRGDIAATIGELGKILDVFRGELLTCCKSQPDVFTQATVSSIQSYVDAIVSILKSAQAAEHSQGEEQRPAEQPVIPSQPAPTRQLPKFAFAVGGAAVLALAVVVLLRMMNAEPVATKAAVFMMNAPLPEDKVAKFCKDISTIVGDAQSVFRITIVQHAKSNVEIVTRLDSASVATNLAPLLTSVNALASILDVDKLFDAVITAIKDTSSITKYSTVHMFGNMPTMSSALRHSVIDRKDTLIILAELHGVESTFRKIKQNTLKQYLYMPLRDEDSLVFYALRPVDSLGFELILNQL
jgi:hypothetical protein